MEIEVSPPHAEYRRVQMLDQDNEALMRDKALRQFVAYRRNRIFIDQRLERVHFSKAHAGYEDNVIRDILQHAHHMEITSAARLASFESQG